MRAFVTRSDDDVAAPPKCLALFQTSAVGHRGEGEQGPPREVFPLSCLDFSARQDRRETETVCLAKIRHCIGN